MKWKYHKYRRWYQIIPLFRNMRYAVEVKGKYTQSTTDSVTEFLNISHINSGAAANIFPELTNKKIMWWANLQMITGVLLVGKDSYNLSPPPKKI